jgi:hypothetical protein
MLGFSTQACGSCDLYLDTLYNIIAILPSLSAAPKKGVRILHFCNLSISHRGVEKDWYFDEITMLTHPNSEDSVHIYSRLTCLKGKSHGTHV